MDFESENAYLTPYANTTFLPMLLLSLMQQKHAPTITDTFQSEYDYIIVGAGSAGSVVASRLSEIPCVSVLLLEAGKSPPLLTDIPSLSRNFVISDISWPYKTVPQKNTARAMVNRQVHWPSGKTVGGSSVINGMLYVRGNTKDYDNWARQGAVGWSYSDVKPYFLKSEDNKEPEYIANGYHAVDGPLTVTKQRYQAEYKVAVMEAAKQLGYKTVDPNGRKQIGFYDSETTIRNGQRCSTAKAYLVPAENRTNLDIIANAFVRKVRVQDGRAEGVEFDHGGAKHFVRAKREVIMSAGSVNSAQLLMLSGIGPKKHLEKFDIPVIADLPVGKNFQDHCGPSLFFELDPNIPNLDEKLGNATNVQEYIEHRKGPLAGVGADPLAFLTDLTNSPDFPNYQLNCIERTAPVPEIPIEFTAEVIEKYFGPYRNSTMFSCLPNNLHPKSRGNVKLHSADPYDPPLIDPKYFEVPEDIRAIVEGLKTCKKIGTSEPLKKIGAKLLEGAFPGCEESYEVDDDKYFECVGRSFTFSLSHQVGTAKMGDPKDPTTVVDPRLKVKGIKGLRVVDASIMPIIPSGNTNIPVIMVAEKASDMIKDTINCYTQIPA